MGKGPKQDELIELYEEILRRGVGAYNKHNLEFFNPIEEAIIIFEQMKGNLNVKRKRKVRRVLKDKPNRVH